MILITFSLLIWFSAKSTWRDLSYKMHQKLQACNSKPKKSKKSMMAKKTKTHVQNGIPRGTRVWFKFPVNGKDEPFTGTVSQERKTDWRLVHFHDKTVHAVHLAPQTEGISWGICDSVRKGRSSLHGKGLFAMTKIRKGSIVTSARFESASRKGMENIERNITASGGEVPPLSTIHHRSRFLYDPKMYTASPDDNPKWYDMNNEPPQKANCRIMCKKLKEPQSFMLFWIAIRVSAPIQYFMDFMDFMYCMGSFCARKSRRARNAPGHTTKPSRTLLAQTTRRKSRSTCSTTCFQTRTTRTAVSGIREQCSTFQNGNEAQK